MGVERLPWALWGLATVVLACVACLGLGFKKARATHQPASLIFGGDVALRFRDWLRLGKLALLLRHHYCSAEREMIHLQP